MTLTEQLQHLAALAELQKAAEPGPYVIENGFSTTRHLIAVPSRRCVRAMDNHHYLDTLPGELRAKQLAQDAFDVAAGSFDFAALLAALQAPADATR